MSISPLEHQLWLSISVWLYYMLDANIALTYERRREYGEALGMYETIFSLVSEEDAQHDITLLHM